MKMSPAQRICAVVLSFLSVFALAGLIPAPQVSGATSTIQTTITIPAPAHAVLVSTSEKPWYYPLLLLSPRVYHRFQCVLRVESRSTFAHPNTGDNSAVASSGIFQIVPILWNRWAWVAGVGHKTSIWYLGATAHNAVTIPASNATLYQQARVAATIYRYDGFVPATWNDGC